MAKNSLSTKDLVGMTLPKFFMLIILLMILFFLPAGTWNYWQGWVYMLVLIIPMSLVMPYLIKHNPDLLRRRMNFKERRVEQKKIIYLSYPFFMLMFILPGYDRRFGWSQAPVWAVLTADVLILLGYGLVFLTFKENTYASRVIEVAEGQKVITSGPYAFVRHPMYVGVLLMYFFTPLALGSWLGLIPALALFPTIILRILDEEKALAQDLPGYAEYMQMTLYRLIPGVW
jgi:protein-S-isoprenylcysteine O-methyltransferase Ste14